MIRKVRWAPGTKKDLRELDEAVRVDFGYGLFLVQAGKEASAIERAVDGLKVKQLVGYGALVHELKGMTMATKTNRVLPAGGREAIESSGNVFADLGLPDADDLLLKAQLASAVADLIREKGLSQRKAAGLLGITQPEVCAIMNGKLRGFSLARLIRSLKALGAGKVSVHIELEGDRELVVAV